MNIKSFLNPISGIVVEIIYTLLIIMAGLLISAAIIYL